MIKTQPQTMLSKDQIKNDKILSEGLSLRKNGQIMFYISAIASVVGVLHGLWTWDIVILTFTIASWGYSRKYRTWEVKNKHYIERLGFTVKR